LPAAELPSNKDRPYQLVVAIRFADDPLFTRLYRNSLGRQVQDQLGNYFGPLAQVTATDEHAVLGRLGLGRLEALELSAKDFAELKIEGKIFLADVSHRDGVYHCQWRQIDGDTQQLGPVHARSTPDRQWLPKALCTAVRDDFAPVAVIKPVRPTAGVDTKQVDLEFRGGVHAQRLASWLGEGAVFQPFWVLRQRDGTLTRTPIPDTVLRITRNDAPGKATVISKWKNPWKQTPRLVGFQAIKLNTQTGRLRLRLVDADTGGPALRCDVYACTSGFGSIDNEHRLPRPDRDGWVTAERPLAHLAYVRIAQGAVPIEFPLPITAEVCELVCKVPVDKEAAAKTQWQRELRFLVQDVLALQAALNEQIRQSNQLHDDKRYEEALKLVQAAVQSVAGHKQAALDTKAELERRAAEMELPKDAQLAWLDEQFRDVGEREQSLRKNVTDLDTLIKTNKAQARADVQVNLGNDALKEGNVEDAIARYEFALSEQPDQPKLAQTLAELKEKWRTKGAEHESARKFVFEEWPQVEVTRLAAVLPQAKQAFQTMQGVSDDLGAQRLVIETDRHLGSLNDLLDQLASGDTDDDKQEFEKYKGILQQLAEFQQQVVAFARNPAAAPAPAAPPAKAGAPLPAKKPPPKEEEEVPPAGA
jgi:tetratricopeptide (TPR) repeat protein